MPRVGARPLARLTEWAVPRRTSMALVVAAAIVLVVGGGVTLWFSRRTDHTTTAVDLGDVVREYRAETSAPPTATPTTVAPTTAPAVTVRPVASASAPTTTLAPARLADPGVYTYTTTGGDGVDALGGASHTYPATTAVVVTPSGCGTTQRWTAAEERWDEATTCAVAGGIASRTSRPSTASSVRTTGGPGRAPVTPARSVRRRGRRGRPVAIATAHRRRGPAPWSDGRRWRSAAPPSTSSTSSS